MDKLYIPAGEIVHYGGMPVELANDTVVLGNRKNFDIVDTERPDPWRWLATLGRALRIDAKHGTGHSVNA